MLNFSPEKLLLVGIIALIVLGPQRLPQAARTLGRFMAQLRHLSESFQQEVHGALHDPAESLRSVASDFRPPNVRQMVRDTISSAVDATKPPPASSPSASSPPASSPSDRQGQPAAMPVVPPPPDDPSLN